MTRMLLLAAFVGGMVSGAGACEWQKAVEAKTDPTVVASIAKTDETGMSTAADKTAQTETVIVERKKTTE